MSIWQNTKFVWTSKENYNKLLTENITKAYKKTNDTIYSDIKKEAKGITEI